MNFENILKELGLTSNEAKIYIALLGKGSMKASEISQVSVVSRSIVYGVLDKLQRKGLCSQVSGNTKKFKSSDPDVVFNDFVEEQERKTRDAQLVWKDLKKLYEKSQSITNPLDYIEILRESKLIKDRFYSFINNVKREYVIFSKAPYADNLAINEPEIKALKRGIKIRCIYEFDESLNKNFLKNDVEYYISLGEDVKIAPDLPLKLAIFDEKITMIALDDPISGKLNITTMVIIHPKFAKAAKVIFEYFWSNANTVKQFKKNANINW